MDYLYQINGRNYVCPLHLALSTVMGKWKGLIVWFLHQNEVVRYGELKRSIGEIAPVSDRVLIQSLRELESDGLIERKVYPVVPPKVEYKLTNAGASLMPVIDALEQFGMAYEIKK